LVTAQVLLFCLSQTLYWSAGATPADQITNPKGIRQALGLTNGDKIAFDWCDSKLTVIRDQRSELEDPSICQFLAFLDSDVTNGRHLSFLPDDLLKILLARNKVTQ
jgi:antitoxin PrlF